MLPIIWHVLLWVFVVRYTAPHLISIDDWVHGLPIARATLTEAPLWKALYQPVNAVHLAIPTNLTTALLVRTTGWNPLATAFVNVVLGTASLALVWSLLARDDREVVRWLLLPITALMLAPQQHYNWLVGAHSARFYPVLFGLLALWTMGRAADVRHLLMAAVAGILASVSHFSGLVVWPMVFVVMVLRGERPRWHAGLWLLIGMGMVAVYLNWPGVNLSSAALQNEPNIAAQSPPLTDYLLYLLTYLGGVFGAGPTHSNLLVLMLMGAFGLVVLAWNVRVLWPIAEHRSLVATALGLMLFALGEGAMNAVGRVASFGVQWGAANHYMSIGVLFWVGLMVLIALTVRHTLRTDTLANRRGVMAINGMVLILAGYFYLLAMMGGFALAESDRVHVAEITACVEAVANAEATYCTVNGGYAEGEWIHELQTLGLVGFYHR